MTLQFPVALVAITILVIVVVVIVRLARTRDLRAHAAGADLQAVERWTALWRWLGVALGASLALAALARHDAGLGRLALAAPAIAGCSVLLSIVVGEWTIRPSGAQRRTATLATRSIAALVPRTRAWIAAAGILTLTTLLGFGALTASPDDQGRAGRAITARCLQDLSGLESTLVTATNSPWPGSFYAVPAALIMATTIGLGVFAARAIRDRANPDAGHTTYDNQLRRDAMRRVVSAVGATAWGTAAPIAIVMSRAMSSNECVAGGDAYAGAAVLTGLLSLIVAIVLMAAVLLPGTAPGSARSRSASLRAGS